MSYNDLRKGRWSQSGQEYFITFVVKNRKAVFEEIFLARAFIIELSKHQENGEGTWLAWVLMPDHFHGLLSLSDNISLADSIKNLKGRAAYVMNHKSNCLGQFWQPGYYDHALRKEEDRLAVARYIVANPLRAGLVNNLGDYPHWDSIWV